MAAAVLAIRSRKRAEAEEEADMEKQFARTGVVQESKKDKAKRKYEEAQLDKEHKDPDVFVKDYGYISPHWFGGQHLPYQVNACRLYNTQAVTWSVAGVILFNFLAIIMEMEVDPVLRSQSPHGPCGCVPCLTGACGERQYPCPDDVSAGPCLKVWPALWTTLDDVCNSLFVIELALNYYGAGFKRFWTSGWNVFDFVVVAVGVLTLCRIPLGSFSQLKMLRTFRVFRLFKRIKSLNSIIVALLGSIPGVINAMIIMFIFMAIYASKPPPRSPLACTRHCAVSLLVSARAARRLSPRRRFLP